MISGFIVARSKDGFGSALEMNSHAAFSESFLEAFYPSTGEFAEIASSTVTWLSKAAEGVICNGYRPYRIPIFVDVRFSWSSNVFG